MEEKAFFGSVMDSIGVVTLLTTEREANFFWVLYERDKTWESNLRTS